MDLGVLHRQQHSKINGNERVVNVTGGGGRIRAAQALIIDHSLT